MVAAIVTSIIWFDLETRDLDGHVLALDTAVEPGMPTLMPRDWESDELPVWRLIVEPKEK